ncbi:phosphonate metabolism transcriptional regulator PhnF [Rhizobium sp. ZPR3]|uniref:Phosphonate metabolism transcriptional regulator PhnF n=2 Tax=unclassified Rhizobium TaxID=2613769 RepID=A0AAU7SR13_9HYPH
MLDDTAQLVSELPRWRQIELSILREIDAGAFKIGEKLPGENALAPHFGVTRTTVRRALTELQNKGILRIEQGRGAFVERRLQYGLGPDSSFMANLRDASLTPAAQILHRFEIAAPADVAAKLDMATGSPIFIIDTIGEASGTIISVTRHHLPVDFFPDASSRVQAFSCITEVYKQFGFKRSRRTNCVIEARLPTPDEASRLGQPRTEPILEVRSVKRAGERAIDYTVARFSAARVSVSVDN